MSSEDKEYRKNIRHIVSFLKGDIKKTVKELKIERNLLSKEENFEKAQILQRKIDSILYVTSPAFEKFDHKTNPNLESDLRNNEIAMLKKILLKYNVDVINLKRIECFDISSISGTNATGSMVVFTNGEKDTSQYRRFKIKNLPNFPNLPNDFAMMQQVISRRLNHPEWPMPNLIIVDGGKGQVSAALKALKEYRQKLLLYSSSEVSPKADESRSFSSRKARTIIDKIEIPVIGLAKREETIIVPLKCHSGKCQRLQNLSCIPQGEKRFWTSQNDDRDSFKAISLPKDSPALHLIMRIRDEAHRFAVSYHRKLRSKQLIFS